MNQKYPFKAYTVLFIIIFLISNTSWAQETTELPALKSIVKISDNSLLNESVNEDWGFENQELGNWQALIDLQFDVSTVGEVSDERAYTGNYSVKIQSGDDAKVGALINDNAELAVFDTLSAFVFIDSINLEEIEMVQIFFLHGPSWDFISQDYESSNLTADSWNELLVIAPEGIGNTQRIGLQFVGKNSSETSVMFIDDISIKEYVPEIVEPEGTWGFENQVFGEWTPLVDLQFDVNTVGEITNEQANTGSYSAKITVQDDANVGALVNNTASIGVFDTLKQTYLYHQQS